MTDPSLGPLGVPVGYLGFLQPLQMVAYRGTTRREATDPTLLGTQQTSRLQPSATQSKAGNCREVQTMLCVV